MNKQIVKRFFILCSLIVIRDHFYIHGNKLLPSVNICKDDFVCVHRCSSLGGGSSKANVITHGHIEDVVILNGNDRYIQLVLNSACTIDFPGEGIFTVEIIPQSLNYRRMITAVRNLQHATEKVQSLIFTRDLHSAVKQGKLKRSFPSSFTLDPSQWKAMEKAIHSSFTIIEGLPGTGKTYIAAAIAEQFYLEQSLQRPMSNGNVLFCCPTDQALNDAENVLSRVSGIRLLRVYNRAIETESFPELATVYGVNPSILNSGTHTISKESALHFRIRSKSNPFHRKIQKYAQQCNMLKEGIKEGNKGVHQQLYRVVEEYKKLVDMAEEFEFTEHGVNIILCSCIEAGSSRMKNHAKIKECIMDESHFCLEAESLVVFQTLGERCDRVVLLGDSRLESVPVIENKLARTFGLSRSLFSSLRNGRGKKRVSKLVLETQHRLLGL